MAQSRLQVADPNDQMPRLESFTRAMDVYTKPEMRPVGAPPTTNSFTQLSEALKGMMPGLETAMDRRQKDFTDEEINLAREARTKNQMSFAEAQRTGLIPEGASPWWTKAYKQMDGEIAGRNEYTSFLATGLQESNLTTREFATEIDAAAEIGNWVENRRADFMKERPVGDADWFSGFDNGRKEAEASIVARATEERLKWTSGKFTENAQTLVDGVFRRGGEDTPQELADFGKVLIGSYGLTGAKFNNIVAEQAETVAVEKMNNNDFAGAMKALRAAKAMPTSEGQTLANHTAVAQKLANAEARVLSTQVAWENNQYVKAERMKKDRDDGIVSGFINGLVTAPDTARKFDIVGFLNANPGLSADAKTRITGIAQQIRVNGADIVEDPEVLSSIARDMYANPKTFDVGRIHQGVADGNITGSRALTLQNDLRQLADPKATQFLESQPFNDLRSGLKQVIRGSELSAFTADQAANATMAEMDLRRAAMAWIERNPTADWASMATQDEFLDAMKAKFKSLIQHYKQDSPLGVPTIKDSPPGEPTSPRR